MAAAADIPGLFRLPAPPAKEPPYIRFLRAAFGMANAATNYGEVWYQDIVLDPYDPLNPAKNNICAKFTQVERNGKMCNTVTAYPRRTGPKGPSLAIALPPFSIGESQRIFPSGNLDQAQPGYPNKPAPKWVDAASMDDLPKMQAKLIVDADAHTRASAIPAPDGASKMQDYYMLDFLNFLCRLNMWYVSYLILTPLDAPLPFKTSVLRGVPDADKLTPERPDFKEILHRAYAEWDRPYAMTKDDMYDGRGYNKKDRPGSQHFFVSQRLCFPTDTRDALLKHYEQLTAEDKVVSKEPAAKEYDPHGLIAYARKKGFSFKHIPLYVLVPTSDGKGLHLAKVPDPEKAAVLTSHGPDTLVSMSIGVEGRANRGEVTLGRAGMHAIRRIIVLGCAEMPRRAYADLVVNSESMGDAFEELKTLADKNASMASLGKRSLDDRGDDDSELERQLADMPEGALVNGSGNKRQRVDGVGGDEPGSPKTPESPRSKEQRELVESS